jgi:dipeptide transport system ATP-binding protein
MTCMTRMTRMTRERSHPERSEGSRLRAAPGSFADAQDDKALRDKALRDKALRDKALRDKVVADKVVADKVVTDEDPVRKAPVLEADRLTRHYSVSSGWLKPMATVRALEGVSFSLAAGRTLAVVGESGCGKSTLARQATLLETPTSGTLRIGGADVSQVDASARKALRRNVQMVFQNPFASLNPRKKIGQALEEPLVINTALSKGDREARAHAMLARVGLRPEHYARYPHMFSGGQRQRIAIARALMLEPKIVVADEPVSALDVQVQAQVLNLLMDLQDETGVAYLFISHNLAVVELIADEVLVMYLGRVMERAPKAILFAQPRHPYTRALLASTPRIGASHGEAALARAARTALSGELPSPLSPPSGCVFRTRCPHAVARCAELVPPLEPLGKGHVAACIRLAEIG